MTSAHADAAEFPMPRGRCPFDPPPELTRRLSEEPVSRVRIWDGSEPWLVTRYDDVRAVLGDRRVSSQPDRSGYPAFSAAFAARGAASGSLVTMDDPQHAVLRRMLTGQFMIKRVEAMRPRIQQVVDELIDDLLSGPGGPVDLVEAFALPMPSLVICELLGVPYSDRAVFHRLSKVLVANDVSPEQTRAATEELLAFLHDLIRAKRAVPGDDLLSRLVVEQVVPGRMTEEDAAAMGRVLLVAGHETTANMITLGTAALLRHPAQLAAVREGTPDLVANAVEELLRYLTIAHLGRRRTATEDIEIGGRTIHAGEGIIPTLESANRDASRFPQPDELDVTRSARHHVAFGHGPHTCLGQPLARVELQVVYGTLFRRIPTLRLARPVDELVFKHDTLAYGIHELPVTW
ncbi:cytochrome P450 [Streptomyces sp. 150FB]|uniref:cytochrome P450 n=1 Tax=Streptomyces sp. 150FB TaxID=1576605 RepID=UPI0005890D83|nr:cytochrome P450 [Streptomyces sp. 150FB]KIF75529.1 cytochrome P450 [Streptomyces sp. 150FB]